MPRTSKGRVVYDRKMHPFNWKDLLRISKTQPPGVVIVPVAAPIIEAAYDWLEKKIRGEDRGTGLGASLSDAAENLFGSVRSEIKYFLPEDWQFLLLYRDTDE